ncbi:WXG100 family type VII secretion target [Streptomyces ochraceiscleroticus]|uniref:ESAT-6-like protein n=1 Tax=Streptomyces ochraceiscleroticus TaxID=47761 RepID=A0ABW1MCM0_9ACTN|nr:WXG100 family type VII secretion target [Streptomyces ochraceiscleroticus]
MAHNDGEMLVDYATLESTAKQIENQSKLLHEDLEWIMHALKGVSEMWEGEAKTAYHTAQTKWNQDTAAIKEALDAVSTAIRHGRDDYHLSDKKGASFFD